MQSYRSILVVLALRWTISAVTKPDFLLQTYRLITVVVARHWGVAEVCAHEQLVNFLSDPVSERSKQGTFVTLILVERAAGRSLWNETSE